MTWPSMKISLITVLGLIVTTSTVAVIALETQAFIGSPASSTVSVPPAESASSPLPTTIRLVFSGDLSNNAGCADHATNDHCDVFTADLNISNGTVANIKQETHTSTISEAYPAWNPNGTTVYASEYQTDSQTIYSVDTKTGITHALLSNAKWPEVHPSGSPLLYATADTGIIMSAPLSNDGLTLGTAIPLTGVGKQNDPDYAPNGIDVIFHQTFSDGAHGVIYNTQTKTSASYTDRSGHCAFGFDGILTVCDNVKGGGIFSQTYTNGSLSNVALFTPDLKPSALAPYDDVFTSCAGASFNYPTFCGDDQHLLVSTSCNEQSSDGVAFSRLFLIDLTGNTPVYRPIGKEIADTFNGPGKSTWTADCLGSTTAISSSSSSGSSPDSQPDTSGSTNATSTTQPVIYVSIASHSEDPHNQGTPNFITDESAFNAERSEVIAFAQMLKDHGAKYNYQSDWNFLNGIIAYDKGDSDTNNKNLLRYLSEDLGVEIDPHSHENDGYNFVDVAYLMNQLGIVPSNVVGGFIAGPGEDSQWSYFSSLTQGKKYPSYQWTPKILWGGGTSLHQNEKDFWISGVWTPQDATHYDVNDATGTLPAIGSYGGGWEGLDQLLSLQSQGKLEAGKIYTVTIMNDQLDLSDATISAFENRLEQYTDETASGRIIWSTLMDAYNAWTTMYHSEPSILHWDELSVSSNTGLDGPTSSLPSDTAGNTAKPQTKPSSTGGDRSKCGDGVCEKIEREFCPSDCQ